VSRPSNPKTCGPTILGVPKPCAPQTFPPENCFHPVCFYFEKKPVLRNEETQLRKRDVLFTTMFHWRVLLCEHVPRSCDCQGGDNWDCPRTILRHRTNLRHSVSFCDTPCHSATLSVLRHSVLHWLHWLKMIHRHEVFYRYEGFSG